MSELALLGGSKAKRKPFPLWPQYDDNERRALQEVLESRVWWRTPGTKTLEFEQAFAAYHGARHGIAVTNTPGILSETCADLAFGLLLATARRISEAERYLRAGKFTGWQPMLFCGAEVHHTT